MIGLNNLFATVQTALTTGLSPDVVTPIAQPLPQKPSPLEVFANVKAALDSPLTLAPPPNVMHTDLEDVDPAKEPGAADGGGVRSAPSEPLDGAPVSDGPPVPDDPPVSDPPESDPPASAPPENGGVTGNSDGSPYSGIGKADANSSDVLVADPLADVYGVVGGRGPDDPLDREDVHIILKGVGDAILHIAGDAATELTPPAVFIPHQLFHRPDDGDDA